MLAGNLMVYSIHSTQDRLVNWLEKRLKIVKKLGTAMIVIMVIGLIVLVGYFAVSRIAAEVTDLIQNFPDIYAQLEEGMREIGNTLSGAFSRLPRGVQNGWTTIVENLDTYMGNLVSKISEPTVTAAGNFAKRLPSYLISFIVAIDGNFSRIARLIVIVGIAPGT
jgi:predicted PurR-regulated permease PerM